MTVSRVSHFTIFEARDPEDLHRAGGSGAETDGHGPVGAPVTELPPHAAVTHPGVSVSALFAPVEPEGLAADGGVTATGAPVPQAAAHGHRIKTLRLESCSCTNVQTCFNPWPPPENRCQGFPLKKIILRDPGPAGGQNYF